MKTRMRTRLLSLAMCACAIVVSVGFWLAHRGKGAEEALAARLGRIHTAAPERAIACAALKAKDPLVLLALGQSNAGNHGAERGSDAIATVSGGRCFEATDPLPGGTGDGGSIWSRLPRALRSHGVTRAVVVDVLAVDATTIVDWTEPQSPLRSLLAHEVSALRDTGLSPHLVLWQQGEADARRGVSASDWRLGLVRLAEQLSAAGIEAPIMLAQSTVCRSASYETMRAVTRHLARSSPKFRAGPDTDAILGPSLREDGCHFNSAGLGLAADRWAQAVTAEISQRHREP